MILILRVIYRFNLIPIKIFGTWQADSKADVEMSSIKNTQGILENKNKNKNCSNRYQTSVVGRAVLKHKMPYQ